MEEYIEAALQILKLTDTFLIIHFLSSALATTIGSQLLVTVAAHAATIGSLVSSLLLTLTTYPSTLRTCTRRMVPVVATGSQFVVCQL